MKPIIDCLDIHLRDLHQRALQLDELNCKVKANLPASLNNYCQVVAFSQGCLVLSATNAAWATELRYCLPELRDKLRRAGLHQLASIKISLADFDPHQPFKKTANRIKLSASAETNLRKASELCAYQPLKEILYRLASRSQQPSQDREEKDS
jgi:hypothetical protein